MKSLDEHLWQVYLDANAILHEIKADIMLTHPRYPEYLEALKINDEAYDAYIEVNSWPIPPYSYTHSDENT